MSQGVLKLPPRSGKWITDAHVWEEWTPRFFRALRGVLRRDQAPDLAGLRRILKEWEGITETATERKGERYRREWELAHRVLVCGEQAAASLLGPRIPVERAWPIAEEVPIELRGQEGWALDCMRLLRGEDAAQRAARVRVAVSDKVWQTRGALATLCLELLRPGTGQVFHHPSHALRTDPDPDFVAAMTAAWDGARRMVRGTGGEDLWDGRWRLELAGRPASYAHGGSASAQALWAWWHVLQCEIPQIPDLKGVIWLAEVVLCSLESGPGYNMKRVNGVDAKTKAIAQDEDFNLIVVADQINKEEAEEALRQAGAHWRIKVVNFYDA